MVRWAALLLPLALQAQPSAYVERTLSDKLPERFIIDVPSLRQELLDRIPAYYTTVDKRAPRRNFRFADRRAFEISELLTSGYVYSDWPELETHINHVLDKVMPPDLMDRDKVHAYVVRDADYNASMSSTGFMFIHIGLINELRDEASLAAVLCHELAHYHLHHSFIHYYNDVTGEYGGGIPGEWRASAHSVKMELQADSLAMQWLLASDYEITGLYDQLCAMERIEKQWARWRGDHKDRRPPSHPGAAERIAAFQKFYEKHKEEQGAKYLVDEASFTALRTACRPEILRVLLQTMDYHGCVRQAFNYHLFEPDEPLHVWYLMEAIRRMCYLDDDQWDKLFIMDLFHEAVPDKGNVYVEKSTDHLFRSFDKDVMRIDPALFRQIQARFYWDGETKFTTYREAYLFFERLGDLLGCRECILSSALRNSNDPPVRDPLLTRYLSGEARHADFARAMLGNTLRTGLDQGKLLVFSGLDAFVRQGKDKISVRVADGAGSTQLKRLTDSLTTALTGRRVVSLPEQKDISLDRYLKLIELQEFSSYSTVAKGERTELHVLDPRYYELFHTERVDEIEFIYCHYGELRGQERTAEAYEEVTNMDYNTIFTQTEGFRYLDVGVSSLREIPKTPMKFHYYGGEYAMKNGRTGFYEMVMEIKRALSGKEIRLRNVMIYVYK